MCGDFNLEPSKDIKAIFKLNITPDKLSGLTDDVGIVTQEQLTEILNTSLAQKVDKVEGKSLVEDTEIQRLSTLENYNDSQIKQDISTIKSNLNTKVDKVDGKQLSTNDFTDTLKSKLDSVDVNAKVYSINGKTGVVTIDVPDISILTPKVVEDLTSTAITIAKAEANTTYKYGTLTSLTITEVENSPLPITIIFTTATSSPTINLPATLESINLADGFEAEKKYVLAIENNIAIIGSIE